MEKTLKLLIEQAQSGDGRAKDRLVRALLDNGCMRQLNKYLHLNRLLEPDDVRSEFWLGVTVAISKVKHEIGSPLQFLTWSGINFVKSALRKAISKEVYYNCTECGHTGQLRRREDLKALKNGGRAFKCSSCGSEALETAERTISIVERVSVPNHSRYQLDLKTFKGTLTKREQEVLNLMLSGYDRESSKNYLKDIAGQLHITPQCVSHYLKKIRAKYHTYFQS